MKKLHLSPNLNLPLDFVTQTAAILAKKRRGKTYTASVIAEEMIKAGLPFVILDPTGAWWGLRASADGRKAGYPVTIIGGEHGDIPLERTAGAVIADLVVDHPGHYILDLSLLDSNAAQDQFATDFAERLYRAKAQKRFPMHFFVDEADTVLPQQPMPGQQRMLGAYDTLVRRGGIRGLGVSLISQRPAVVNKNALSQVECLIVLQIVGAADQDAVERWVKAHDTGNRVKEFMTSLASLGLGEAWIWSPSWLNIFQRTQIRKRETFNSSKTPEVGEHAIQPKVLAAVDLAAIREKVAATIEKVNADDPKTLRARISELQRQLSVKENIVANVPASKVERVEIPILKDGQIKRLEATACGIEKASGKTLQAIRVMIEAVQKVHGRLPEAGGFTPRTKTTVIAPARFEAPKRLRNASTQSEFGREILTTPRQRILDALAWLEVIGVTRFDRNQVAFLAGQSPTSSGYTNNLSALKTAGFVVYPDSGTVAMTEEGRQNANFPAAPGTTEELHRAVMDKLPTPRRRILDVLLKYYPRALLRAEVAEAALQSPTSSGYTNNLCALKSLGLIEYPSSKEARAADMLFLEAK